MRRAFFVVVLLAVVALSASVLAQPAPVYRVIVNPKNPASALDRKFVEEAFLKKITSWPSGETIQPVDLPADSPVRQAFTRDVLERSVDEVRRYWQQRIFSGRDVPPPELATDADVVRYVLEHDGSIGYVSGNANPGAARVVVVR